VVEEVETVPVLAPEDLYRKFDSILKIGFVTNTQKRESKKWQSDLHDLFLKHATDMVLDKNYLMSENRQVLRFMIHGAELHQKKYEQKKPVAKVDKQEL
jgi:hypothetical protein